MRLRIPTYLLLLLALCPTGVYSQAMAPFSLFSEVQTYYNPAATGRNEVLTADFFYHQAMVGMPGTPSTQTFIVHAPMKNPKVALGLQVEHDALGASGYTGLHLSYAYRLSLGTGRLALGLRAGIVNGSQASLTYPDEVPDPILDATNMRFWIPNIGFGVLYYTKRYWVGASFPRFFGFESNEADEYTISLDFRKRDYFAMAGGNFTLGSEFGIEPSLLLEYTPALTSPKFTVNAMGVYKGMYKAGIGYRFGNAVIMLIAVNLNRQFSLGYSYDLVYNQLKDQTSGGHELHLQYKFGYKINASNPRDF